MDLLVEGDSDSVAEFPLTRLLNIFLKVCEAISFAHSRGVIHRDLKPANIMVGEFGEVLVMDWGLAKVIGQSIGDETCDSSIESVRTGETTDDLRTMDGQVLGSPRYMSPEQARGAIQEVDERSDVYALGAILYQILTLHPPVQGSTLPEIMQQVRAGDIPDPSSYGSSASRSGEEPSLLHMPTGRVPSWLGAVAMKALAPDKPDRYAETRILQAEIENWQGGFATAAESASAWRQTVLFLKRNRMFGQ